MINADQKKSKEYSRLGNRGEWNFKINIELGFPMKWSRVGTWLATQYNGDKEPLTTPNLSWTFH